MANIFNNTDLSNDHIDNNSDISAKETLTRNKKNKIYHYLLEQLRKNKYIYSESSEYYRRMNLYMIIPCLFFSSISSILSFVSSSSTFTENQKTYFALSVGVIAIISTLLQSINSTIGFSVKNELFEKSADEYAKLIIKVEFEMLAPNEHYQEFINLIEEQMNKIQQSCKYFPPQFILDNYINNKKKLDEEEDETELNEIIRN